MSTNDWLAQLKVGDTVIVVGTRGRRSLDKVSAFTPTLVKLERAVRRFKRFDGREYGGSTWDSWSMLEATPDAVQQVRDNNRKREMTRRIQGTEWETLPLSVLEQVNAVLESHSNAKEEG